MSLASSVPRDAAPAAPVQAALPAGTRLGDYRIERTLGQGGYGIVYLATDLALQRPVAIKEYLPIALAGRADDGGIGLREVQHKDAFMRGLQSFLREARLLAQFDHPSLVRVYRFWEEKHTAYMAMSYCDGPTLKAARQQMDRPPDEAWVRDRLLLPLLGALQALHQAQCLHRDVSPSNILLGSDGRPMLLDFGSARRVVSDMTQPLTAVLNPSYAAIEQFAESPVLTQGPWTDLYSLAAVAYYAVTGREPVPATVRAVNETALMPMAEVAQLIGHSFPALQYSAPFVSAIDRALAVRPGERPQSVEAFRSELLSEHVLPDVTIEGPGLHAVPPPSPDQITLFGDEPAPAKEGELDEPTELAIRAAIDTALGDIAHWPSISPAKSAPRIEPVIAPLPLQADDAQADAAVQAAVGGLPSRPPATAPAPPAARTPLSVVHPAPAKAAPPSAGQAAASGRAAEAAPPVATARLAGALATDTLADTAPLESAPLFDADEGLGATDAEAPPMPRSRRPVLRWAAAAVVAAAVAGTTAWQLQKEHSSFAIAEMLSREPTAAGPSTQAVPAPAATPATAATPTAGPMPDAAASQTAASQTAASQNLAVAAAPAAASATAVAAPAAAPTPGANAAASSAAPMVAVAPDALASAAQPSPPPAQPMQDKAAEAEPAAEPPSPAPARPARARGTATPHKEKPAAPRPATRTAASTKPATADSPRAQCGGRTNFSLYYCMQTQCKQSRFTRHPQCQRLREHDEVS